LLLAQDDRISEVLERMIDYELWREEEIQKALNALINGRATSPRGI
jgi:hypothetical protein